MPSPSTKTLKSLKKWDLVEVIWYDHWCLNPAQNSDKFLEKNLVDVIRKTLGYYLGQNERWLAIASTDDRLGQIDEGDGDDVEGINIMLICAIKSIRKLSL
jgi:hypothetical protein